MDGAFAGIASILSCDEHCESHYLFKLRNKGLIAPMPLHNPSPPPISFQGATRYYACVAPTIAIE